MATAVLSTAAKARAREAKKEARKQGLQRQGSLERSNTVDAADGSGNKDQPAPQQLGGIPLERVTSHLSTMSYLSLEGGADGKDSKADKDKAEKDKKKREPTSFLVPNVSRVVPAQYKFLSLPQPSSLSAMDEDGEPSQQAPQQPRYRPVKGVGRGPLAGIIMLRDSRPGEEEEVTKVEKLVAFQEAEMAPAPEPFEWDPNDE